MVDPIQRAIPLPALKITKQRAARRKVLWNGPPLAPSTENIKQTINKTAFIHMAPVTAALRPRDQRRKHRPFLIRQIARVAQTTTFIPCTIFRMPHANAPRESIQERESQMIHQIQEVSGRALMCGESSLLLKVHSNFSSYLRGVFCWHNTQNIIDVTMIFYSFVFTIFIINSFQINWTFPGFVPLL